MTTVAAVIDEVHALFEAAGLSYGHGTDNPWDEAVALVLTITGMPDDTASLEASVPPAAEERIRQVANARVNDRQPLAYLLGECAYMGLRFEIRPGVVVPRSPIGYLLHEGLTPWLPPTVGRVLDLCSGSGCLGIVAAGLFTQADAILVELDPTAADLAERNVHLHGLADRVTVLRQDATALPPLEPFDLIMANPPYVDHADMQSLPEEYRAEPELGLAGGDDGLRVMLDIIAQLPDLLAPEGVFVGEVGNSAPALLRALPDMPFIWPDLPHGGEGVFVLEGRALASHTAPDFA